ncbi:hypothetical protein IQ31_05308 [Sphingobacterium siyangense]|uniref:Uncharacterized protein n=1 Tax=Sphingobacterium siyangense TaxID=459529 RepID=A0A562M4N7_9SPHI|nr:hypothetical protein IQ31_05308 [Sphingobacterium siyangense]
MKNIVLKLTDQDIKFKALFGTLWGYSMKITVLFNPIFLVFQNYQQIAEPALIYFHFFRDIPAPNPFKIL